MPLQIRQMTEADLPLFIDIITLTFDTPMAQALWQHPPTQSDLDLLLSMHKQAFAAPESKYMCVVDTDLPDDDKRGKVIAAGSFSLYMKERTEEELDKAYTMPEGVDPDSPWGYVEAWLFRARRTTLGPRPHVCINFLAVLPEHHRRGAGSMLLQWAFDITDKAGIETYLEASGMGRPLYYRLGFDIVHEEWFDTARFGQAPELNTWMVRQPNPDLEGRAPYPSAPVEPPVGAPVPAA